jgi:amino acid transporter
MTDYVLNVAVSVTAGTAAAASAFPDLWPYRTLISVALLVIVTIANLRGLRESGAFMTVPVFFFLTMFLAMIAAGIVRAIGDGPGSFMTSAPPATAPLTLFLVMHTFAAGCTALTGVESISNGVPIFKPPEPKHARQTMAAMAILMGILFMGTTGLTQYYAIVAGPEETILSALVRRIWGSGLLYLLVQASSLLVLMVAANTSFVGFPRVASLVARDGYLPRQLAFLGDRLVYSNGIMLLAGLAAALVLIFEGDTHLLIPLFAVGAFLAFTLSQAGMVFHWLRAQGVNWRIKALLNGFGMGATALALIVIGLAKFLDGAWMVVLLIPVIVLGFRRIRRHYDEVAAELALSGLPPSLRPLPHPRIVLPIANLHRGVIKALRYARAISSDVTAIYVEVEPGSGEKLRAQWDAWGCNENARLEIVSSPYRSVLRPFLDFLDRTDREHNDGQLATVLLTDLVPAHGWEALLHNQTTWAMRLALLYRRRNFDKTRAIIDVPFFLRE